MEALLFVVAVVLFIAWLRFNVGPGGSLLIPIEVDFQKPFPAADPDAWDQEYLGNVIAFTPKPPAVPLERQADFWPREPEFLDAWQEYASYVDRAFISGDQHDPYG